MAYTSHGHYIPASEHTRRPDKSEFCGGLKECTQCQDERDSYKPPTADFYDEQTLTKVFMALRKSGLSPVEATNALSEMQNSGVLFRERRPVHSGGKMTQYWTPYNPCPLCGAMSNTTHVPACSSYNMYDENGKTIVSQTTTKEAAL